MADIWRSGNRLSGVARFRDSEAGYNLHWHGHDLNGNLQTESEVNSAGVLQMGQGRTTAYTSFNLPSSISKPSGGLGSPAVTMTFQYNADHQRTRKIAGGTTTIYLNPADGAGLYYEKDIKSAFSEEHRHFVTAGGEVVALVKTNKSGGRRLIRQGPWLGPTALSQTDAGSELRTYA